MVKKRSAALAHGIAAGAAAYIDSSPRRLSVRRIPFVSAADYARNCASDFAVLDEGGDRYMLEPARTIGDNDALPLHGRSREMYIARVDDAVVESLSYILRVDGVAIGDFENQERNRFDDCPELDAGIFAVDKDEVLVIDDGDASELTIDEAFVSLLGPHSPAFGHWIWHQLPRVIVALERGNLKNMPILIERGMPATHRQALELIIGDRQMPIVEVPFFGHVRVRRAWYVPMPFLMPYLPIPNERWRWDLIAPSPARFQPILKSMHRSAARLAPADPSIGGGTCLPDARERALSCSAQRRRNRGYLSPIWICDRGSRETHVRRTSVSHGFGRYRRRARRFGNVLEFLPPARNAFTHSLSSVYEAPNELDRNSRRAVGRRYDRNWSRRAHARRGIAARGSLWLQLLRGL
jgi:hypothetical protein